ncbi:hypothetical protein CISG_10347 [Coccidioides immitis RMSCC 3703]|uniref:Uncharacterized protein n=2 Tax=Coccidioides immitis TaxID=5501 RepID=A0A0J8TKZ3_COCIT|nr:hypothetical protein CIRG_06365 [Coccidioides immitis RMSCC 2394]KMU74347.1 hypothetical protein CISG_10347 [Coccidioides immitis RMSCC 3703]
MAVGNALLYILRMGLYFSEEHVAQATKLINRKLLGLDKHPKCLHLEDFNAMDDHPAPSKPSILPNIELPEETLDEIPDEILDPWTSTKTLVFQACIDGSISFSLPPDKNLPEMVIFEVKCAHYETGQDVPVLRNPESYHTFMIAQNFLSFHISIGTYDKEYLDYIFSSGNVPVVSQRGKKHFL